MKRPVEAPCLAVSDYASERNFKRTCYPFARQQTVESFLSRIGVRASQTSGPCSQAGSGSYVIQDAAWRCCAELNLVLQENFSGLGAAQLRGYHSFTRNAKDILWANFLASHGYSGADFVPGCASLPLFIHVLFYILRDTLQAAAEASLVKYTFQSPQWLLPWCRRWNHAGDVVTVVAVQGFAEDALPTVFVPVF